MGERAISPNQFDFLQGERLPHGIQSKKHEWQMSLGRIVTKILQRDLSRLIDGDTLHRAVPGVFRDEGLNLTNGIQVPEAHADMEAMSFV